MRKPHSNSIRSIVSAALLSVVAVSCMQPKCTFLSDTEFPLMPPFRATVERKEPCAAYLKTTDGRWLCVGGPGASPEISDFVQFLQRGQVCVFPNTFLEYQKRQQGGREP